MSRATNSTTRKIEPNKKSPVNSLPTIGRTNILEMICSAVVTVLFGSTRFRAPTIPPWRNAHNIEPMLVNQTQRGGRHAILLGPDVDDIDIESEVVIRWCRLHSLPTAPAIRKPEIPPAAPRTR